jgi:hypothetical protein
MESAQWSMYTPEFSSNKELKVELIEQKTVSILETVFFYKCKMFN